MATLEFCGHSTVVITSDRGTRVVIDPWFEGNPACPTRDPGKIDLLLLTHGHSDHTGSAVSLAKRYSPMVCATYELAMLLIREGVREDRVQPMNKGGSIDVPGTELRVSLTNAFHSSCFDASDGKTYYAGEPCGVVLRLESGKTIYHAGDTSLFGDMKLIGEMFTPDVALLPIGDRFTMDPVQAAQAVRLIRPKVAVPIHHSTFPLLTGKPERFVELLQGTETRAVVLAPGEQLTV